MSYRVITDFPIACDSPDHTHPYGAIQDNNTNSDLVREIVAGDYKSLLDIGCAGGCFVHHLASLGLDTIGIEGSSKPRERNLGSWPLLGGTRLFTADATRKFSILRDDVPAKFDIVTSWECLEHLRTVGVPQFVENLRSHMSGIFVGSITSEPSIAPGGVDVHQTQKPFEWWEEEFNAGGLTMIPYPFKAQLRPACNNFLIAARLA